MRAHFNNPIQFTIGDHSPEGAVRIYKDSSLDLEADCGGRRCPSVIIFAGSQYGTIDVTRCFVGQMYYFVNKSGSEYGLVVQHKGGIFGARAVSQYDMGVCFCYERGSDEIAKENRMTDSHSYSYFTSPEDHMEPQINDTATNSTIEVKQGGVLLCR